MKNTAFILIAVFTLCTGVDYHIADREYSSTKQVAMIESHSGQSGDDAIAKSGQNRFLQNKQCTSHARVSISSSSMSLPINVKYLTIDTKHENADEDIKNQDVLILKIVIYPPPEFCS